MRDQLKKPRHMVLRRPDGSIRLILPTANSAVLRGVLGMYFPSRLLGKLYRAGLKIILPIKARFGRCEDAGDTVAWCPGLNQALLAVPTAQVEFVGALISEPGPRSKLTLKIMDARGSALAYGRIGYTPMAIGIIKHETEVLRVLEKMPIARQVPRLLGANDLDGQLGCFLMETTGPDLEAGNKLTHVHFEFLTGLKTGSTLTWVDVVEKLEQEAAVALTMPSFAEPFHQALVHLRLSNLPDLAAVIEHGDFAPWNLRLDSAGHLFALDWEHSRLDGLPWMDALHFVFQHSNLVLRADGDAILTAMRGVFKTAQVFDAKLTATPINAVDSFLLVYFIRKYSRNYSALPPQDRILTLFEESIINTIMKKND